MSRAILVCVLLTVATLAAYWPATQPGFDFVDLDDSDYARNNEHVRAGLTIESIRWAMTSMEYANWFPLTWLSLMLDAELWREPTDASSPGPQGFHITNVVLHAINTLLLLGVLRSYTGAFWRSALVAGLFALHPMHVESVAWVSERKDVLSTMFWLLTMWAYVWWVRGKPRQWERYVLILVLFVLGLMSKSMLVTLPCVLLLTDYWPLRRLRIGELQTSDPPAPPEPGANGLMRQTLRLFAEKLPLFALVAASSAMTMIAQRASGAMPEISKRLTLVNVPMSYIRYIGKMFWPADMASYYPFAGVAGCPAWEAWQVIGAVLMLGVVSVFALVMFRRAPWFIVGWLWFVGTMVPVIGLVQVGSQGMADRYTYVPYIGLFIIVAWTAGAIVERITWMKFALSAAFVAVLAAFVPVTRAQVLVWRNTEVLYLHTLNVTGPNWRVRDFLAGYYVATQRLPEALEHYRAALILRPDNAETQFKTGFVLASMGLNAEARERFEEVIRLDPDFADAHFNLALVLSRRGENSLAKLHLQKAIELNPAGEQFYLQNLQLP